MNSAPVFQGMVWDLGGLFIQVFPEKSGLPFARGSGVEQTALLAGEFEHIHQQFECGLLSGAEFDSAFAQALGGNWMGPDRSDDRRKLWNSVLGPWQSEALNCVKTLMPNLPKILLSNTNQWHQEVFEASFLQQFAKPLNSYFDRIVYSHQCGMRKPNPFIYLHAIHKSGIEPSGWIMIDDNQTNLNGAKQAGLQTCLHPSNSSPVETMIRLGLLP